jgi:UDP-glucuronate 4-epimerase
LRKEAIGIKTIAHYCQRELSDVPATYVDIDELVRHRGFKLATDLKNGIGPFIARFQQYHRRYGVHEPKRGIVERLILK